MLCDNWYATPINGVNTAPPIIAITIKEEAGLEFAPSPRRPRAKIVGNIKDMKKLVRKIEHMPIQPGQTTAIPTRMTFVTAKAAINLAG